MDREKILDEFMLIDKDISDAMMEAIWIMRWNKEETAMTSVLTSDETMQMCINLIKELNNAGYKIVKQK